MRKTLRALTLVVCGLSTHAQAGGNLYIYTWTDYTSPQLIKKFETETGINWQNFFYFLEWIFFGLFALYIWYRMVKDAWLEEQPSDEADDASVAPEPVHAEQ